MGSCLSQSGPVWPRCHQPRLCPSALTSGHFTLQQPQPRVCSGAYLQQPTSLWFEISCLSTRYSVLLKASCKVTTDSFSSSPSLSSSPRAEQLRRSSVCAQPEGTCKVCPLFSLPRGWHSGGAWLAMTELLTARPAVGTWLGRCDRETPSPGTGQSKIQLSRPEGKRKISAATRLLLKLEMHIFKKGFSNSSELIICSMLGQTSALWVR